MSGEASQEQVHGKNRGTGANSTDGIHVGLFAVEVVDDVLLRICVDCDETCGVAVERFVPLGSVIPSAWCLPQLQIHSYTSQCRPDYIFFSQRFAQTQIREVPYFHRPAVYSQPRDSR